MKKTIGDMAGIAVAGILLTWVLVGGGLAAQALEASGLFPRPTSWLNVDVLTEVLFLFACPVLLAFLSARRSAFNPVLAGIATCLVPALLHVASRYGANVVEKIDKVRSPHIGGSLGYVDPCDLWGNLVLASRPVAWAFAVGTIAGALVVFGSRRSAKKKDVHAADGADLPRQS